MTNVTTTPVWIETTGQIIGVILTISLIVFLLYMFAVCVIGMYLQTNDEKEYMDKKFNENKEAYKEILEYRKIQRQRYIMAPWKKKK